MLKLKLSSFHPNVCWVLITATMPSQALIDLFDKIREDENAHKIVSLLHLMLHMGTERLEGGEQAPVPVCVQTQELLEQKAIVKSLGETIDQQNIIVRQLEQKNKDLNTQLMDLHKKNLLITEVNKRLYVKCKRLEGQYEELCQLDKSMKEDVKEQRSLMLELQQRLERLEAKKNVKEGLMDSEDVKKDVKREVGELCHQIAVTREELKEQKSFILDLQKRQDALLTTKEDNSKPCNGQKKSSSTAGKENVTEEEKEKQPKMTAKPHDAPEAVKEQQKSEKKESSATPQEPPRLRNRNKNCKDKVAAFSRTSAKANPVSDDKPRNPTLVKVWNEKLTTEKKTTTDKRKPRVTFDSSPNLKDAKPLKVPLRSEKKEIKLQPILNKDKTTPLQRPCVKENVVPGQIISNRCRTMVTNAIQASRQMPLKNPVQVPQDTAKTRNLKFPTLGQQPLLQYQNARQMATTAPEHISNVSPLFPVTNIVFQRDEDFSSWKHDSLTDSLIYDGENNEGAEL